MASHFSDVLFSYIKDYIDINKRIWFIYSSNYWTFVILPVSYSSW